MKILNLFFVIIIFLLPQFAHAQECFYTPLSKDQQKCLDNLALKYEDLKYCDQQDNKYKDDCYIKLSLQLKDSTLCARLPEKTSLIYNCYTQVAAGLKDLSVCDDIKAIFFQTGCYREVAKSKEDMSICSLIADIEQRDICYESYAHQFKDIVACEQVVTTEYKQDCYKMIGNLTGNAELCEQGGDNTDICFKNSALIQDDPKICQKVKDLYLRDLCLEDLGIESNLSGKCGKVGERISRLYLEYPEECCSGLTVWNSGMDTRKVVDGECVQTNLASGNPVSTCLDCGNGKCEDIENICNCPQDCDGTGVSVGVSVSAVVSSINIWLYVVAISIIIILTLLYLRIRK